jgi:hypothetical protein
MKDFNWLIFITTFVIVQCLFVGIFMLIRKYQNRKLAKKAVLARMTNQEVQEPRTIDMIDWQRSTLIGLSILGIRYMKNKRKKEKV